MNCQGKDPTIIAATVLCVEVRTDLKSFQRSAFSNQRSESSLHRSCVKIVDRNLASVVDTWLTTSNVPFGGRQPAPILGGLRAVRIIRVQ